MGFETCSTLNSKPCETEFIEIHLNVKSVVFIFVFVFPWAVEIELKDLSG